MRFFWLLTPFLRLSLSTILLVASVVFFTACDSTKVYDNFVDFDEGCWHKDSLTSFSFNITEASQRYNLKAKFRNAQSYPYHNLYYHCTLKDANDSILNEIQKEIFLFDPTTGKPCGSGLGNLFDHSQAVMENYTFPNAGSYSVDLKQFMRLDTLPFILSVGWRVEQVE